MISETFFGIQGEGKTQGRYRQFIRFNNCSLFCNFCDTHYAWGKGEDHVKLPRKLYKHLVLTGGCPLLPKTWAYIKKNILTKPEVEYVEIETNGTQHISLVDLNNIRNHVDLWNISPKEAKYMTKKCNVTPWLLENKDLLNDYIVKFVVKDESDLKFVKKIQKKYKVPREKIWLMPYTTPNEEELNAAVTEKIYDLAFNNKYNFSARLHVLIKGNKRGI